MKRLSLFTLCLLIGASCRRHTAEPAPMDVLTASTWCDGGSMLYQFEEGGSFVMRHGKGKTWGGNWHYRQPLNDVEINLRYGPDRRIQIIRLRLTERTATQLTGIWTDEVTKELTIHWRPCHYANQ